MNTEKKRPAEYAWLIEGMNAANNIPLLVAGQATNTWACHFQKWDREHNKDIKPNLDELLPFTSGDMELMNIPIEILRETAAEKGEILMGTIHDPFDRCAPADHSIWQLKGPDGKEYWVQVMNRLEGTSKTELLKHTVNAKLSQNATVELPDPIALLPGKIANLLKFDQRVRQDLRHCQMLACCTLAFLATNCEKQEMPSRKILNDLERFYLFSKTVQAKRVESEYGIKWDKCYPLPQISSRAETDEKIRNWLQHQSHRRTTAPPPKQKNTLSNEMEI